MSFCIYYYWKIFECKGIEGIDVKVCKGIDGCSK